MKKKLYSFCFVLNLKVHFFPLLCKQMLLAGSQLKEKLADSNCRPDQRRESPSPQGAVCTGGRQIA